MNQTLTTQVTQDNAEQLGNWWSLTEAVQNVVKETVPNKDTWTLHISKAGNGDWVFSLPQFLTFNEALTNGTEKSIDAHYKRLTTKDAVKGDTMLLTVSSKEIKDATTTLLHWQSDPLWSEANYYVDTVTDMDCWLCPYVQVLFKEVPKQMWFTLVPTE